MDLWTATTTVLRRWYVFVPALLVGMVAVVLVVGTVDTKYRATGKSILLAPAVGEDEQIINPYLQGGVGAMVVAIENAALDQQMQLAALAQGYDGDFLVFSQPNSGILNVQAETVVSPEHAVEGVAIVTKLVEERVLRLQSQAGAPPEQTITMGTISEPIEAETLNGSRVRAAIALTALAVFGSIAMALLVDGIARSRVLPPVRRPAALFGRGPRHAGDATADVGADAITGAVAFDAATSGDGDAPATGDGAPAVAVPASSEGVGATAPRSSGARSTGADPAVTASGGGRSAAARSDRRPGSRTTADAVPSSAGPEPGRRDIDLTTGDTARPARSGATPAAGRASTPDRKDDDRRPRRPGGQPADR